jgi:hypothetical protein
MSRKLYLLLVTLLASGLLAVGCGDDDDDDGGSSDEPAATQEESGGNDSVPSNTDEAIAEAKRRCKQAVDQSPQADAELKADLNEVCDKLESPEDVTKVVEEICVKTVEKSLPAGPTRDQAKESCKQSATP